MKKYGMLICTLLLCVCFVLSGCGNNIAMPKGDVTSNGGNTIIVGDYLYFANTFVDRTTLKSGDNDESKVKDNAIYRIKTVDGKTKRDKDGNLENVEKVMSKIAGFDASNMFAKGDYLYFTSPNAHKSSLENEQGKDRFDLTTLFRCKLDGTNLQEILTTQTSSGKFYLAKQDKKDVLFIFDDNKLQTLEINNKVNKPSIIKKDVLDVVFPENFGEKLDTVYYTASLTKEEGKDEGVVGNKLYKLNVNTKEETLVRQKVGETIELVDIKDDRLYYTRDNGTIKAYYSNNFKTGSFETSEIQHTHIDAKDITDFCAFGSDEDGNVLPVIFIYKEQLYIQPATENYKVMATGKVLDIELITNEYVYYSTDKGIYRKSYKDPTKDAVTITEKTNIKTGAVDFDGRFLYFYAKTEKNSTENYYLHRVNTKMAELGGGREDSTECLANVKLDKINEEINKEQSSEETK